MWEDPIVKEVRRIREELSAQFNFDVSAIFADIRKKQTKVGSRLVRRGKEKIGERMAAPDRDSAALHPGR